MPGAQEFIERWESESTGRPYVMVSCFGLPRRKVFLKPGFRHMREQRNILDVARRFRFLPCVKELLIESTEEPIPTRDGNLMLEGKAPTKEIFRVILGKGDNEDGQTTYKLITFYPVSTVGRR
jgi:hypothetical protein